MIIQPLFKKKEGLYLYNFIPVYVLEILFPSLNESKNCKMTQLYLEQTTLAHQHLALLRFFPIRSNIFSIIDQCKFFFTSGVGPDILMNVLEDCIVFLTWFSLGFV